MVHTSYNLNVTRMGHAEATRVAHACFWHMHAMTRIINYLRVQGYTRLYHLFSRKVQFYMHTRVLAVIHVAKSPPVLPWPNQVTRAPAYRCFGYTRGL